MQNGHRYRRRVNDWLAIGLTGLLLAACSGAVPGGETSALSHTQVEASPAPQPSPAPETPSPQPDVEPGPLDPRKPGPPFVPTAAAERIGTHLRVGSGREPGLGAWTVFLYMKGDRVGFGIRVHGRPPALGCCLTELRSPMRPLAFVQVASGWGFVVSSIDARVEGVRFNCGQCRDVSPRHVHITHIANGKIMGIPQLAVAFVRPTAALGNDGSLIALGNDGPINYAPIGLPPVCFNGPPCPNGLAWGVLTPGTEKVVDTS
jgi:hypothetical protein